ncbi:MAG TPA: prephenate dehydratase [Blastocatellia bacterium]|nr:prephenate dehydratase [Blastocatellia bacterium]
MTNGTVKAAYQGEPGAFSDMAARAMLGPQASPTAYRTFEDVFRAVSEEEAACAVVPIENSLAGSVLKNYDLLIEHDLTILGEIHLKIIHNLIAPRGVKLSDVRTVYSHPVALAQCERFLRANPRISIKEAYDTAGSVKMVVENGRGDEAAVASRSAAEIYDARIIVEGIEDNPRNYTRFLLLALPNHPLEIPESGKPVARKTSLVFSFKNRAGALFRALAAFALRDIDLTKIESRPIEGRPWEYMFYLDLVGDSQGPNVRRALDHLAEMAENIRVLGCYPSASKVAEE